MSEVVPVRSYRTRVPKEHCTSLDTRLRWLWHQRFGSVQNVYTNSPDVLDVTAATLILQAIIARDLRSIDQLFNRLEGAPIRDDDAPLSDDRSMRL